jgi:hypothetical protein
VTAPDHTARQTAFSLATAGPSTHDGEQLWLSRSNLA